MPVLSDLPTRIQVIVSRPNRVICRRTRKGSVITHDIYEISLNLLVII
jgi:hypothetical protein